MAAILETQSLSKSYAKLTAVEELSLTVEAGSVYGILGPNGSGKTTTLGMVLGVINADRGSYSWFGGPPDARARRRIGALLETPNFYPYLSGRQNLKVSATIKECDEQMIDDLLRKVNLFERRHSPFRSYSLGMKQRLALASAMLGAPEVLVLDEPTNGLDPVGIADVRALIVELAAAGTTIVLASHILEEVEKVCSHVAVLKQGRLLADGDIRDVLGKSDDTVFEIAAENLDDLESKLHSYPGIRRINREQAMCLVTTEQHVQLTALSKFLAANDIFPTHLAERKAGLESEFLELVRNSK